MEGLNSWLEHWYPTFWSVLFIIETVATVSLLGMAIKEYRYDELKDLEKKQKRTRTSKKVTEQKDGGKVTEEVTEVSEPIKEGEGK